MSCSSNTPPPPAGCLHVRVFRPVSQSHHGERGITVPLGTELPENEAGCARPGAEASEAVGV